MCSCTSIDDHVTSIARAKMKTKFIKWQRYQHISRLWQYTYKAEALIHAPPCENMSGLHNQWFHRKKHFLSSNRKVFASVYVPGVAKGFLQNWPCLGAFTGTLSKFGLYESNSNREGERENELITSQHPADSNWTEQSVAKSSLRKRLAWFNSSLL